MVDFFPLSYLRPGVSNIWPARSLNADRTTLKNLTFFDKTFIVWVVFWLMFSFKFLSVFFWDVIFKLDFFKCGFGLVDFSLRPLHQGDTFFLF